MKQKRGGNLFIIKFMIFMMIIQGIPFGPLSESYEWNSNRLLNIIKPLVKVMSTRMALADTDVKSRVLLVEGRLQYNRKAKISYLDISLKNISDTPVSFPVRVVIASLTDTTVTVKNPDGTTFAGKPYFEYAIPSGSLAPGATSGPKTWKFKNPLQKRFNYTLDSVLTSEQENQAPVANAGQDQTITLPLGVTQTAVTLTGSLSNDSDGTIAGYNWSGDPKPQNSASPKVNLGPGVYTFVLVVTDNKGAPSAPDMVTVTVKSANTGGPPQIILNPLSYSVTEGGRLSFNVSASDPDSGDVVTLSASPRIENATFTATSGVQQALGTFSMTPGFDQQGKQVITFKAIDPWGQTATVAAVIDVTNLNRPPSLTGPEALTVDEGQLLTATFKAQDPDGDSVLLSMESLPTNAIFIQATGTLTFASDYNQAGKYTVTCKATDGTLSSGDHTLVITVNNVPTSGSGTPTGLVLKVNPAQTPTLLSTNRISGTVNSAVGAPPPQKTTATLITALFPSTGAQGQTLQVALTGQSTGDFATHFAEGASQVDFGEGITVNSIAVTGAATATAGITIDPAASVGTRSVTVTTGKETAVSVLAFNVTTGKATVTGKLVDSDTGLPIGGALVSLQGTTLSAITGGNGVFTLTNAPSGPHVLIINAPNHELVKMPLSTVAGQAVNLPNIESHSTVFDPSAPPGASLHSILGRGITDTRGKITVSEARQLIIDTLIFIGGNEAGVLDAYGNQLNPLLQDAGKTSLRDNGVESYATRLAMGQSVSLMEVLLDLSFGLKWNGGPPTYLALQTALQGIINQAWANPYNANSRVPLTLFNQGKQLSPNPPTLSPDMRLNSFQAYVIINGFMSVLSNHQGEWASLLEYNGENRFFALADKASQRLSTILSPASAFAADPPGIYTITWEELISKVGKHPSGPSSSTASGTPTTLPDFEALLKKYYLDYSEDALAQAKQILLTEFASDYKVIEQIFAQNPFDVKTALDELIRISESDQALRDKLGTITSRDATGSSGAANLWAFMEFQKGVSMNLYWGPEYLPPSTPRVRILQKSWAPATPYIYFSEESTVIFGSPGNEISMPSAKISFFPSGDDEGSVNPADLSFVYRLWRIESGTIDIKKPDGTTEKAKADLTLVAYGQVSESPGSDKDFFSPKKDPDATGRYMFNIPLPPAGMNRYRIDCIRFKGPKSVIDAIDKSQLTTIMKPWLAGFLDDPTTIDPLGRLGRVQLNPGEGFLKGHKFETSHLSNASSVYVSGGASGFAKFGRVDLAADYKDSTKVYMSIPGFKTDAHGDRGTGSIFRYNVHTAELEEFDRPAFMTPGQIGLALDSNFNLYTENGASEALYGGKIFRILGHRTSPTDPAYKPPHPNPMATDAGGKDTSTLGDPPARLFVGSVNYYSRMNMRANPAAMQAMIMGGSASAAQGDLLYVADALVNEVKSITVQASELLNFDPWHIVGQRWAWNNDSANPAPANQDKLNFTGMTDMAFDRDKSRLFVTQGAYVVEAGKGANNSKAITRNGTIFVNTSGCAVCEATGEESLFVSDHALGGTSGRILRIPLADLPITVPAAAAEKDKLVSRYTFLTDLDRPGQVRITDDGNAMVFVDNNGIRYVRFGFTGKTLGVDNAPLIGAVVTVSTFGGTLSATSDADGVYNFPGISSSEPVVMASVSHPARSYTERITLLGRCNAALRPAPCPLITSPANGSATSATVVTVKGTIFPKDVNFSTTGGALEVTKSGGASASYPLVFTGTKNEFQITGVALDPGDNFLLVRVNPTGDFGAGGSLTTQINSTSTGITTQSISGAATDADGNPVPGAKIKIFVNGAFAKETTADGCGYYNETGLPLGTITVTVVE